ncbi:MAG: hypothetical protein Q9O62_13875 [Ardenticatenia bacterium]|nr:hypothetical protein [Ardenticatenia bacterium]
MHLKRIFSCVVVLVGLVVFASIPLYAQGELGDGTVRVKVEMGTAGESLPDGLEVELLFLANGQGPPIIFREPVVNGVAEFPDLATAPPAPLLGPCLLRRISVLQRLGELRRRARHHPNGDHLRHHA